MIEMKNTYWGVSSDIKGQFRLEVPATDSVILIFTFVGKKTKEITIHKVNFQKPVNIIMYDDIKQMEEAVVTGITSNLSKQSFTGSAVTVTQEQLLKVSKTNVSILLSEFKKTMSGDQTLIPSLKSRSGDNPESVSGN